MHAHAVTVDNDDLVNANKSCYTLAWSGDEVCVISSQRFIFCAETPIQLTRTKRHRCLDLSWLLVGLAGLQ